MAGPHNVQTTLLSMFQSFFYYQGNVRAFHIHNLRYDTFFKQNVFIILSCFSTETYVLGTHYDQCLFYIDFFLTK